MINRVLPGTDCARAEVVVEDGGNELLLERGADLGVVDKVARKFRENQRCLVPIQSFRMEHG